MSLKSADQQPGRGLVNREPNYSLIDDCRHLLFQFESKTFQSARVGISSIVSRVCGGYRGHGECMYRVVSIVKTLEDSTTLPYFESYVAARTREQRSCSSLTREAKQSGGSVR